MKPVENTAQQKLGTLKKPVLDYRHALCSQYIARARGVLHLGAHFGKEAPAYAAQNKPVVWVEAMPDIHARLTENLAKFPHQTALCALLGDQDGLSTTFNISNNSEGASSSIFEFGAFGSGDRSLWPDLKLGMVKQITLPMTRLDSLLQQNAVDAANFDYWVIDLQGAEKLALEGATNALNACSALLIEVSTAEVYQNGVLWPELRAWLETKGFVPLWEPQLQHDDVLFIRHAGTSDVIDAFHSDPYLRHTQRRLEHLASLGLDLFGKSVLEVGAGIGDHTGFYLDRGCSVLTTDARPENLLKMQERFTKAGKLRIASLDMDHPVDLDEKFELIHCYGLLYHLQHPARALEFLCRHCDSLLLLETCVSYGDEVKLNPIAEPSHDFSQAFSGQGCRPTRAWVVQQLKKGMPYVYCVLTQPSHPEFPLDWSPTENKPRELKRAVFVASRVPLDDNPLLIAGLPGMLLRAAPASPMSVSEQNALKEANTVLMTQLIEMETELKRQHSANRALKKEKQALQSKRGLAEQLKHYLGYRFFMRQIKHLDALGGKLLRSLRPGSKKPGKAPPRKR